MVDLVLEYPCPEPRCLLRHLPTFALDILDRDCRRAIHLAAHIAQAAGFRRLAVIASVGTRLYYAGRGFTLGDTYMVRDLPQGPLK